MAWPKRDIVEQLLPVLTRVASGAKVAAREWPDAAPAPERLGFISSGGLISLPAGIDLLDRVLIHRRLGRVAADWVRDLQVHPVIGSTNSELMALAAHSSVDGQVHLAELQLEGRGRRGREWYSPFGANLALTMGFSAERPASELGGLSLVVGLAVLDALERQEVPGLSLKWPNDLLLAGAKLGGILIEIASTHRGIELIVGIGINIRLPLEVRAVLDQPVADLAGAGLTTDRSTLAAAIISSVCDFVGEFQEHGFVPFRDAFNARHHYHEAECLILNGSERTSGQVSGVTEQGALLLRTDWGVQTFHGGEVSLRPAR